jgi:serine/threonine protein kinase
MWALGIIIHEMLAGYPPFYHRDAFEIYQLVLNIKIDTDLFPTHFDKFAKEILQKLLTKSAAARIGSSKNGAEDIKKHKWYRGLNWAALYNKQMVPPIEACKFQPAVKSATDLRHFRKDYPVSARTWARHSNRTATRSSLADGSTSSTRRRTSRRSWPPRRRREDI